MKKTLSGIAMMVATVGALAQAQINFATFAPPQVNAPVQNAFGQPCTSAYMAALYVGTSPDSLQPIATAYFLDVLPGHVVAGLVDTPYPAGTHIYAQIRAWNTAGGKFTSYQAAYLAFGEVGESNIVEVDLTAPPALPPNLVGLQSFQLYIVPEPSTIALGLLGAAALLLRRRSR